MMQRQVTAIVLCVLAQAASAQCVATSATPVAHAAPVMKDTARAVQGAAAQNAAARPGGELIKAAAAGTRDDAPPTVRDTVSARGAQDDDHPRRGGTAMLLAALALMSGIALRRYGSRDS
jgi:hypothetical protein